MSTCVSSSVNDEEEENFLHIYKLVVGVGTEAFRDKFDGLFHPSNLLATLKKEEAQIRRLGQKKRLTTNQINILFPSSGTTSSKQYDISLMMCLIRNLVSVKPPINGFDDLPLTTETSMESDLARIKYYRNKIAHADSDKIATIDFRGIWPNLVGAIVRLGGTKYKNICDELIQTKLSKNCITDLRQEIAKLQEETRDNIQQLKQDIDNQLETKVGVMNEKLQDIHKEIIAELEELESEKTKLITNMTNIDSKQQKMKQSVSGLEGEKIESNKRLLEIKKEQDDLKAKLDELNNQNLDVGIKIKEIKTNQQELQNQIGILHGIQHKATESEQAGKAEVEGIKAEIDTFKEDKERIKCKMEKLELEQEDPVPKNIREQIIRQTREWESTSKDFISTRAYKNVLVKLRSHRCVVVTGCSGSGKSAIVRQASLSCRKDGYQIITIYTAEDLRNYYRPGRKTVFVLDDLCGKFTANEEHIYDWDIRKDVLDQVTQDVSCKIVASCRLQVYQDPKFSCLKPFKSCECNIVSEELCLTKDERKQIFQSYLSSEFISDDILSTANENFPLLCQQYSIRTKDHSIEKYFKTPFDVYEEELKYLRNHATRKLCALCLCIMFNNKLQEKDFQSLSLNFKKIVKDTCECIGLSEKANAPCLRTELDMLNKTYVNKHNGVYQICHDNLFDYMAYYFGKMIPQCFINHADSGFLRERFLWKKVVDSQSSTCLIENIVYLDDDFLSPYIQRMILDWTKGKVSDVFYNINMKYESFIDKFLKGLAGITGKEAKELANMKDIFRDDFASGNTPLIISCLHGNVHLLKWLLEHEANVNDQRSDGASALCMACEKNHAEAVNILLEHKADINLCTKEGASPLGVACFSHGNLNIISELLEGKANVNEHKLKKNNMTPLFMACKQNFLSAASTLLNHRADHSIYLKNGTSALLVACQNKNTDIVQLLLQYKADPNASKNDGNTPLFSAAAMGLKDITELLLANGAEINKCVYSKEQIIQTFEKIPDSLRRVKKNWVKIVKKFGSPSTKKYIKRIIGREHSTDYVFDVVAGSSPLHMACFMGQIEIIRVLTKTNVCVDIKKQNGTTPLFYACEIGHLDIISVLLKSGADPKSCTGDQCSPLDIARLKQNTDVLSLLNL